jgi:hypothetical protein
MPFGPRVCACCGEIFGVEAHHLYLRADGCPDDLTVWLCNVCHARAHQMKRRVNIRLSVQKGQAAAKARGVKMGRLPLAEVRPNVAALVCELHGQRLSLRKISAELAIRGHLTGGGKPYSPNAITAMLGKTYNLKFARQRFIKAAIIARELHRQRLSLRKIAAELAARGHLTGGGKPYSPNAIAGMLQG